MAPRGGLSSCAGLVAGDSAQSAPASVNAGGTSCVFPTPDIITIIKSRGEEGACAEDLSCDEGDKRVQEFGVGCAVTTAATGVGRQAVPGGLHLTTTDPHLPLHRPGQSPPCFKQTLFKACSLNPIGMLAARCCSWQGTPAPCSHHPPPANLYPELCRLFLASTESSLTEVSPTPSIRGPLSVWLPCTTGQNPYP